MHDCQVHKCQCHIGPDNETLKLVSSQTYVLVVQEVSQIHLCIIYPYARLDVYSFQRQILKFHFGKSNHTNLHLVTVLFIQLVLLARYCKNS